jgi:hypothetical protein
VDVDVDVDVDVVVRWVVAVVREESKLAGDTTRTRV